MKTHHYLLAALIALNTALTAVTDVSYKLIDLGGMTPGSLSTLSSINDSGQIVGHSFNVYTGYDHAVLFDSSGAGNNTDLGTLGGAWSWAFSINNGGQIVGRSQKASSPYWHATLFDTTGAGHNVAIGDEDSAAYSINNSGKIVGESNIRATLFDETGNGNNIQLSNIASEALSINDTGQIAGWANDASFQKHATLFDASGGGNNITLGYGYASSINDFGKIVGYESGYATIFDPTGQGNNVHLGIGTANCINNFDQVVGWMATPEYTLGVLFDPSGSGINIDLNTLISDSALYDSDRTGWFIDNALGINNNGWITAVAYYVNFNTEESTECRAVLLQPMNPMNTPEPATVIFLMAGGFLLRKRK